MCTRNLWHKSMRSKGTQRIPELWSYTHGLYQNDKALAMTRLEVTKSLLHVRTARRYYEIQANLDRTRDSADYHINCHRVGTGVDDVSLAPSGTLVKERNAQTRQDLLQFAGYLRNDVRDHWTCRRIAAPTRRTYLPPGPLFVKQRWCEVPTRSVQWPFHNALHENAYGTFVVERGSRVKQSDISYSANGQEQTSKFKK